MEKKMIELFYGTALHDIGKVVQRQDSRKIKHSIIGADFIKDYTDDQEILNCIKYHHFGEVTSAKSKLANDSLAYITYIADNIASGTDRRSKNDEKTANWQSKATLEDIFNVFGPTSSKNKIRKLPAHELDLNAKDIFPSADKNYEFTNSMYMQIVNHIANELRIINFDTDSMQSLLNILEATLNFVPSSTDYEQAVDISLYDHIKLTTAFACAIYQYRKAKKTDTDYQDLLTKSANFYKEQAFLMAGFDISGIGNFVYTIVGQGAHKQLRSRSFYAEMICEWVIDVLLRKLNLTRANLFYNGSSQAYLILANTSETRKALKEVECDFNQFFLKDLNNRLKINFGMTLFSASQVMEKNGSEEYLKIFKGIEDEILKKRSTGLTYEDLQVLNSNSNQYQRECAVCHAVSDLLPDDNKCILCDKLEKFSGNLQKETYFIVNDDESGLPIGPNVYLHTANEAEIRYGEVSGYIYSKNQFSSGKKQQTYLWIADYSDLENNDFSIYVQRKWKLKDDMATGIQKLGALMLDVDDLEAAFLSGFAKQKDGRYTTISRYATLSRRLSQFFKVYLNSFASGYHVTIVYAGNDNIFLLGAWDDVLALTLDLQNKFAQWTDEKITFSAGIGIFDVKDPINIIARRTNELLLVAKFAGKDRICLFEDKNVYEFAEFQLEVVAKLEYIRSFFKEQTNYGASFIYNLLDLIRSKEATGKLSFARLAYYLTRLEDSAKNKDKFNDFKKKFLHWVSLDRTDSLELALMLYVYEIRED